MLGRSLLVALVALLQTCQAVDDTKRQMDLWSDGDSTSGWNDNEKKTFTKITRWEGHDPPSYVAALTLAKSHWKYLDEDVRGVRRGGYLVVAVMYTPADPKIPGSIAKFTASSTPRGPRYKFQIDQRDKAPAWYAVVDEDNSRVNRVEPVLCAEDSVHFLYETTTGSGVSDQQYPAGSFMAVWGSMDGKDHTGSEWSPCATKRTSRAPGCQDVALKLGVNYRTRDSITGNPALGRLPGDLPPELPQDPPSIDDITGTFDLSSSQEDAMDRFEGAANSRRLAVRRQHDVRAHDRSVDHVPVPQIRGRGPTLLPREPAATSAANKNTASPDAVMTWPLVSGTIKFPTSQQSATTADPALAKLTAGSSPSFTLAASPKTTSAPQTAAPAKTKAASSVFCSMHNQDPDSGVTSAFCVCQGSKTLPLLSVASTAVATEQCHYTSLPGSTAQVTPKTTLGPATTNTRNCQICTPVGPNEDDCTSMTSCTPKVAQVTNTVGSSSVHVGPLTGTALYTSISKALETACPSVTQTKSATHCQGTEPVKIPKVAFKEGDGTRGYGELELLVDNGFYDTTPRRDAMIKAIAYDFQASASGNSSCYKAEYEVVPAKLKARWLSTALESYLPKIFPRVGLPPPVPEHETWCTSVQYAEINYYGPNWRAKPDAGPDAGLRVNMDFHASDPGATLLCDFAEMAVGLLTVVAPEILPADVAAEEGIQVLCDLEAGESKFDVSALAS